MAIRKVSRMGHPVLRQRAAEIPPTQMQSPQMQRLIDDMIETMIDYEGIGLAAPQVFEPLRLIVLGDPAADPQDEAAIPLTVLFNPQFTAQSPECLDAWEGCLSIPQLRGVVPRAAAVEVRGYDREGRAVELEAEGLFARVLQHEIDHLDGVLFLDRMDDLQTLTFLEEYQRYWLDAEA
ncbi:MAG: peptide deformylase [Gemmatimonadetes bacterium]|nr:peptide deformylase [Gemmatimonadota bacterium]